jgi:hypothetical protein
MLGFAQQRTVGVLLCELVGERPMGRYRPPLGDLVLGRPIGCDRFRFLWRVSDSFGVSAGRRLTDEKISLVCCIPVKALIMESIDLVVNAYHSAAQPGGNCCEGEAIVMLVLQTLKVK